MNFWKVILATVVIFGAGVTTGGLLVNQIQHSHPKLSRRSPASGEGREPQFRTNNLASLSRPSRPPEILGDRFVQQLDDALKLTPDQRASIQKIITDGQERNRSVWTNNSAQMREVIQDVRHRIREALTPDQQKQFEEMMKHVTRRQNSTNAPTGLLTPPLTGSNFSSDSNVQAVMILAERLKAQQGTNPQSNIIPSPEINAPTNAPAE